MEGPVERVMIQYASKEFSSKKPFSYRNLLLECQANGNLRLSTPNSGTNEILLPVAMTLSVNVDDVSERGEGQEDGGGGSGGSGGSSGGILNLLHVERSKEKLYHLRLKTSTIKFDDRNRLNAAFKVMQDGVRGMADRRPKKILAIINPNSGWGKGVQNFDKSVKPILDAAGIEAKMVPTKNAKHIYEIVEEENLADYDAVLGGGGDGTLGHVFTALARKSMKNVGKEDEMNKENPTFVKPNIAVGTLPLGSGNGTSLVVNMTKDLTTIACNIVLGYRIPFDLLSVHDMDKNYQMVAMTHLAAGYASFFQDAEKIEERRWCGPLRYMTLCCGLAIPDIPVERMTVKNHRGGDEARDSPRDQGGDAAGTLHRDAGDNEEESWKEEDTFLNLKESECLRKIVDGELRQCSTCVAAETAEKLRIAGKGLRKTNAAAITISLPAEDKDKNGAATTSPWMQLPNQFIGTKCFAMAINVPVVQQIDVEDPRWKDMHAGNGEGLLISEVKHGACYWTKMILACYRDLSECESMKEPQFCRMPFVEAKISLKASDEAVGESASSSPINVNADGEVVAITNNLYVKVHRGLFHVFGTGRVEGHPKLDGVPSLCQYRCFLYSLIIFVASILVLIVVGIGYLIKYLASL